MLDSLFGGSLSSRLFQEIREKRGLVYSVYSFSSMYQETGPDRHLLRLPAGAPGGGHGDRGPGTGAARSEPVPEDELQRAKEHLKGRMILGLESTSSRMTRLGKGVDHRHRDPLAGRDGGAYRRGHRRAGAGAGGELYRPATLSVVGIGADESSSRRGARGLPGRPRP